MMYVRGDRIRGIQNWLQKNKVVTVSELQYRRTGSGRHPRPYPDCIYNWPEKMLYDILTRKEYLGHTILWVRWTAERSPWKVCRTLGRSART